MLPRVGRSRRDRPTRRAKGDVRVLLLDTRAGPVLRCEQQAMRKPPRSDRIYVLVGQRVAGLRAAARMSQTDLASRCELARGTVANIEGGRQRPTLHTLWVIAEVLQTDVGALIPTRDELAKFSPPVVAPRMTQRLKRAAGQSASKVAEFIESRGQEVEGDAQPQSD